MKRTAILIVSVFLIFSVAVLAQTPANQAGPEYKILDVLIGDWTIQGKARDTVSGPEYTVDWTLKGQRILGGFFLEIRHVQKVQGAVLNGLEITGLSSAKKSLITHIYFDDGSWVISTPTFIDERTCIEDGTNYFPDGTIKKFRTTYNFNPDGKSLSLKGETEQDGKWWTSFEGKGVKK